MQSRLPAVGTNIFTVMSALAAESGAVNLGQGFPDFDPDPVLIEHVAQAMRSGHNQYAPLNGVPMLRERLSQKIRQLHGHAYCADTEIMVTAGATQAVFTAVMALTQPGDEVLVLGPGDTGEPTADAWATWDDTIGYEIVTRLGARVPRRYIG